MLLREASAWMTKPVAALRMTEYSPRLGSKWRLSLAMTGFGTQRSQRLREDAGRPFAGARLVRARQVISARPI